MANYKVYEIKFKDGMVYYGYTAKPFKMRMAEHIDASQKGKSILYKKMRKDLADKIPFEVALKRNVESLLPPWIASIGSMRNFVLMKMVEILLCLRRL